MDERHEVVFGRLKEGVADVAVHDVEVGAVWEGVAETVAVGFEGASELSALAWRGGVGRGLWGEVGATMDGGDGW